MTQTATQEKTRALALACVLGFLSIVLIEHLADSSLNPAEHEISEYVHGPAGWLMSVGFVIWAISLAAAGIYALGCAHGKPVAFALFAAAVGVLITAGFATQTSAGRLPPGVMLSTSGRLHDIGSGVTTIGLLAAALLSLRLARRDLRRVTLALVSFAVLGDVVLLAVGSDVGGIRQRLLVAVACAWQLLFLGAFHRSQRTGGLGARRQGAIGDGARQ